MAVKPCILPKPHPMPVRALLEMHARCHANLHRQFSGNRPCIGSATDPVSSEKFPAHKIPRDPPRSCVTTKLLKWRAGYSYSAQTEVRSRPRLAQLAATPEITAFRLLYSLQPQRARRPLPLPTVTESVTCLGESV